MLKTKIFKIILWGCITIYISIPYKMKTAKTGIRFSNHWTTPTCYLLKHNKQIYILCS